MQSPVKTKPPATVAAGNGGQRPAAVDSAGSGPETEAGKKKSLSSRYHIEYRD